MIAAVATLVLALAPVPTDELVGRTAPELDVTWIDEQPAGDPSASVVVFWATWCSSCKRRFDTLATERDRYAERGVRFVGVAIDDDVDAVRDFVSGRDEALPFVTAHDRSGATWRAFGGAARMAGIPFGVVLGAGRQVVWHGPLDDELFRRLEGVLDGRTELESARAAIDSRADEEASQRRIRTERARYLELAADPARADEAARLGRLHLEAHGDDIGAMCYLADAICSTPGLVTRDHELAIAAGEAAHRAAGGGTPSVMNVYALALFEGGRADEAIALLEGALELAHLAPDRYRYDVGRIVTRLAAFRERLRDPAGEGELVLPLLEHSTQLLLPVWLDGEGPLRFTFDTGSTMHVCVDERLRERLELPVVGKIPNMDGSGTIVERDLVALGELCLTEDSPGFGRLQALVADYAFVSARGELLIDGILGFPLFEDRLLTVDYGRQELRVGSGALDPGGPGVVSSMLGPDLCPHVALRAGDVEVTALIDTGYTGALTLPDSLRTTLPLEGEPRLVGRTRGPNGTGGRVWRAVPDFEVRVGGVALAVDQVGFVEGREESVIGRLALDGLALSFDQRAGLVRIRPSSP